MATAALAHYDALFFLPPIALAVLWRAGLARHRRLRPALALVSGGAGRRRDPGTLLRAVPGQRPLRAGDGTDRRPRRAGFPYNNVPSIVASATLYLGTAFPVLVAALIVLGGPCARGTTTRTPSARIWLLGLVWAAVPLLFYAFVARKPGTHVHVATSGLMLLAGAGFASLWAAVRLRPAQLALAGAGAAALALVGAYLVPIYLQTTAEVVRENRVGGLPLAWRPPGGLPTKERFGFPYQAGWKTVGALYADGTLVGSYDSNEQPQVTHWYTRGAWRCSADPRYYLIAENVQDEIETPSRVIGAEYHQIGTVTVAGEPKLRVFERGAAPSGGARPTTWPAEASSDGSTAR